VQNFAARRGVITFHLTLNADRAAIQYQKGFQNIGPLVAITRNDKPLPRASSVFLEELRQFPDS